MPNADHRFCVRHLYSKFKTIFKGKELKDKIRKAAIASTIPEFELHLSDIQKLDKAHTWLRKLNLA